MHTRVTQNTIAANTYNNLQTSMGRLQDIQNQLSSGKKINKPSDDPTGATKAMSYRSDISRLEQYDRNGDDGIAWLGTADNTLTSIISTVGSVRDRILQGANSTADPEARQALAEEVKQAKATLLGLANTTYNNRAIFAGSANPTGQTPSQPAYADDGTYNGNTGVVNRTVGPNATVQVNVDGPTLFGTPGADDLWHVLDDIETHLRGSDSDVAKMTNASGGTASDIDRLDALRINLQNRHSEVGARYHRVETMQSRAQDDLITAKTNLSTTENIDLPATTVALNLQNTAYQAALAATAKVIQPSLVSFLS